MSEPNLKKVFNNHLVEFLEDVIEIFPENVDLKTGLTMIEGLKFAKPSILITIWKTSILDLYEDQIMNGDEKFFINKNYSNDLAEENKNEVLQIIDDIKKLMKETTEENRNKTMKYVQNLTKICKLYYQ
jgi:ferredoxin-fold anticodon binding domain-containing protein